MHETRRLETKSFDPAAWGKIGDMMTELRRGQIIHLSVTSLGIHLAVDETARRVNEKAIYGTSALAGIPLQYVAVPSAKMVFIVGKGIAARSLTMKDMVARLVVGVRQIVAKNSKNATDIVAAKIAGDLDFIVATNPEGPYTSLVELGFTWATYCDALGALIAGRADGHLYTMLLTRAEQGAFAVEHWTRSKKACKTGAVLRFPFRISHANLCAVPIRTEHGMETVDMTNLLQGQIHFIGDAVRTQAVNDVLAVTDDNEVLVAPQTPSGTHPQSHIVPRMNLRAAATIELTA